MRRIIRISSKDGVPLGWVEVGKTIFAFSQNLSAGDEFPTTEEAIKFVKGLFENVRVEEVERN